MRRERKLQFVYLFTGLIVFFYVFIRAIQLGVTYDEAYTISSFVHLSFTEIINYSEVIANNHILNTLLIKLFYKVGSDSLFMARLPNVLAFLLYLYFAYKLTFKKISSFVGLACFLLLILNPFLLDFFGLARGYGLSLGLMMAALYFTVENTNEFKTSNIIKSISFGALSVLSNFSMLNFFVILVFVLNLLPFVQKDKIALKKTLISSFILGFALLVIIYEPVRKLHVSGALIYGGNHNFYTDTLISLTKYSLYSSDVTYWVYFWLNSFLIIFAGFVLASYWKNKQLDSIKNIFLVLTFLCVLSVVVQHYLLGTLYLIDRTALFFYPLLIFCFCFAINDFSKYVQRFVISALVGIFLFNFVLQFNLYKTVLWSFDSHTAEILDQINQKGKEENRTMKVDFSWPLKSSINYYIQHNKYRFVEIVKDDIDYNVVNPNADYYIFLSKALENTPYKASGHKIHSFQKGVFLDYPKEQLIVFKELN